MLHLLEGRVPTCIICNSSVGGDLSLLPHVFLPLLILAFYGYGPVDHAFVLGGLPNPTLFCCLNGEPVPVTEPIAVRVSPEVRGVLGLGSASAGSIPHPCPLSASSLEGSPLTRFELARRTPRPGSGGLSPSPLSTGEELGRVVQRRFFSFLEEGATLSPETL